MNKLNMHKVKVHIHKLDKQKIAGALIIIIIVIIGVRLLTSSHAESPYASVEAESGTLGGGSTLINDPNASGGKAVQFNTASSAVPTYPLKVVGNTLEGANGTRFVVKGAAQYFYAYDDSGSPDTGMATTDAAYYANDNTWHQYMVSQGLNLIRIGLGAYEWDNQTYMPEATYETELGNVVTSASNAGLAVELGNWDSMGDGAGAPSDYTLWHPFWLAQKSIINAHPNIVIEPFNEPNNMTDAQWLSMWEGELSFWRGTASGDMGYTGVIVVDTNNYSAELNPTYIQDLITYSNTLSTKDNLLFSIHFYATAFPTASAGFSTGIYSGTTTNEQEFDSIYTQYEGTYPEVIDETGNRNGNQGNGNGDYNDASSATSPEPYPEDPNNFFLYLSQFSQAMATDVAQHGLNGEDGFAFSWAQDDDCMINYCVGSSPTGNPATPSWNSNWGQIFEDYYIDNVTSYY
jgi:hypothetical protein